MPSPAANENAYVPILSRIVVEDLMHDVSKPLLPDLIESFVFHASSRLQRIRDAIARGDFPTIKLEAETLTGTADTFGASRLSDITYRMGQAADERDLMRIESLLNAVCPTLQATAKELRQVFAAPEKGNGASNPQWT